MAFNKAYLAPIVIGGPDIPTIWSYKTTDSAATCDSASYFEVGFGLKLGDIILRTTVDSLTAPTSVTTQGFHTVSGVSSTVVDVNDTLAVTATDTD